MLPVTSGRGERVLLENYDSTLHLQIFFRLAHVLERQKFRRSLFCLYCEKWFYFLFTDFNKSRKFKLSKPTSYFEISGD